jgi:myosin heavy subunit
MNEADYSDNRAFDTDNFDDLPQLGTSCPFYSVLPNQNKLPQLPPAQTVEQVSEHLEEIDAVNQVVAFDNEKLKSQKDWVAEPDIEKQAEIGSEFKQLLTLNEELRSANDNLYEQVEALKEALRESEKVIQWQKKRSNATESILNQHTLELAIAQEQIQSLFQQLETSQQTVQRQETLVESYRAQLELSQQRVAQLERECTLIQANYNEQSHLISQSENVCRELRARLMRQQRQTLQFKAALEKCLDTTVPSYDPLDNINDIQSDTPLSFHTHAEPIRPWSADSKSSTNELDNLWGVLSPSEESDWESQSPEKVNPTASDATVDECQTQETPAPKEKLDLEEQLDSVIQLFFASAVVSSLPVENLDTDANEIDDPLLETSENENSDSPLENPLLDNTWETVATPLIDDEQPVIPTTPHIETTVEVEDYWSDVPQVPPFEFTAVEPESEPSNEELETNSPSPLLYPNRPPKGRKSLASVELPNFRSQ